MHEWMEELKQGQRVLDLGAGAGSLKSSGYACSLVSVDSDEAALRQPYVAHSGIERVVAVGEALPFASSAFDLVLCNHVLEHIENLSGTVAEISRVLKPAGRLYVAVPNGHGLCDGIYRYLFEGGGHVNRFDRQALVSLLEGSVAVRLTRWKKLYSSFAYLARVKDLDRTLLPQLPARLRTVAHLPSGVLWLFQGALYVLTRFADRAAGVDWALYGWALYLDRITPPDPVREDSTYINVCLHCGSGHPAHLLGRYHKVLYRCPSCDRWGVYFPPFRNGT